MAVCHPFFEAGKSGPAESFTYKPIDGDVVNENGFSLFPMLRAEVLLYCLVDGRFGFVGVEMMGVETAVEHLHIVVLLDVALVDGIAVAEQQDSISTVVQTADEVEFPLRNASVHSIPGSGDIGGGSTLGARLQQGSDEGVFVCFTTFKRFHQRIGTAFAVAL